MVVSDLNARIGDWSLTVNDTSDDVFGGDVGGDSKSNRQSQDKTTDLFGKILIDLCTTFHCTPLNGNHAGQFTFVSNQANSVVDYCIVSADFISKPNINFEV